MTWAHIYWSTTALHVLTMFPVAMEIFLVCILPLGTCGVWFLLSHYNVFHFVSINLILQLLLLFCLWSLTYIGISDVSHMTLMFSCKSCSSFLIYAQWCDSFRLRLWVIIFIILYVHNVFHVQFYKTKTLLSVIFGPFFTWRIHTTAT